ncbi:MAG: DUF2807 domain-containing protein [Clostridia bacterium]|nr:DUF2807 domain-containing protein [Clostridia bacterium]
MKKSKEFKDLISELRKEKGLTQEELAGKLRITPQAVSKWERGGGMPDVTLFPDLAKVLGVSIGKLFGEDQDNDNEATIKNSLFGLPLVHHTNNAACYSDKVLVSADNRGAVFEDHSTVDFSTRSVTNRGPGEIRIVEIETVKEYVNITDSSSTSLCREYSDFTGIGAEIAYPSSVKIMYSEDGFTGIKATGTPMFIANIEAYQSYNVLNVKVNPTYGHNSKKENNSITVFIPETCRGNHIKVTGSSDVSILPDFDSSFLSVTGSGTITARNVHGKLCATISGSGIIEVGDVEGEGELSIAGSGIINAGELGERFEISIAGSGDITAKKAKDASTEIAGSGDIKIGEVSGTLFSQIAGSGEIYCKNGEVDRLTVAIYGSGDFHGNELTAKEADILSEGSGNIELYRITDYSTEQISEDSELRVKIRG